MSRNVFLKLSLICVVLLGALAFTLVPRSHAPAAHAAPAPVTRGDVEAILHTQIPGGLALLLHAHQIFGAPFEDFPRAAITPLSVHNGAHYCVDDWHLMRIHIDDAVDQVFFFTKEQAIADLQETTVILTLDGVALPTTQTPITMLSTETQHLLGFPGPDFGFQIGSILAPSSLTVGPHTAGLIVTDPVFGFFQDASTFTVDPSGTGACLQS